MLGIESCRPLISRCQQREGCHLAQDWPEALAKTTDQKSLVQNGASKPHAIKSSENGSSLVSRAATRNTSCNDQGNRLRIEKDERASEKLRTGEAWDK